MLGRKCTTVALIDQSSKRWSVNLPSLLSSRHLNSSGPLTRRRLRDSPTTWWNTSKDECLKRHCVYLCPCVNDTRIQTLSTAEIVRRLLSKKGWAGREGRQPFRRILSPNLPFLCLLDEPNMEQQHSAGWHVCCQSKSTCLSPQRLIGSRWPRPSRGAFKAARN